MTLAQCKAVQLLEDIELQREDEEEQHKEKLIKQNPDNQGLYLLKT